MRSEMDLNDDLQRDFDRLADGELSLEGQRRLVALLDDQPAGWRSCALALLEERAMRSELRELRSSELAFARNSRSGRRPGFWTAVSLATAAGLMVSFALGWAGAVTLMKGPIASGSLASGDLPPRQQLPTAMARRAAVKPSEFPWQRAVIDFAGGHGQIDVPVRSSAKLDASWLGTDSSALPSETVRELERTGFKVKESGQSVWPIQLGDGRRLMVPVEEVEVQYVGREFQ